MKRGKELLHYRQCGLDNVWLAGGWRVEDTEYGGGLVVENADRLHRAIARAIAQGPRPLRGQDARFLRVMLDLSQEALAGLLGVDRATVIRWEKARKRRLSRMQDIALRATYAARAGAEFLPAATVLELQRSGERGSAAPARAVFQSRAKDWREKKAA